MSLSLSKRAQSLGTENAFVVLAEVNKLIAEGYDITSFCIGQPDFPAPMHVQEAGHEAIRAGKHGYTPSAGIMELRQAAAQYMGDMRGLTIEPEDVVVGSGAKPFIAYTILSTTDYGAGDEVIYPVPGFPIYESQITINGAVPVPLYLREARNFAFDPNELEAKITPKTKLLILNSPQNPTGGILTKQNLEDIAAILRKHPQIWVFCDEIYSRLTFEGSFSSLASLPDMQERCIISDGASKTWAMTGWRIGYAGGPQWLIKAMGDLQSQSTSNPCSISQYAVTAALNGPQDFLKERNAKFKERRDLVVAMLNDAPGLNCPVPEGAFYVYPDASGVMGKTTPKGRKIETDADLIDYFLDDWNVAAVHGGAFGLSPGFRISYATSNEALKTACERIQSACAELV
ncbi:MAG: pyridoxal phosphate-dependent aminotransferase [Burkholderiales bacterium]|nr:MAG: pyridoxal phosphate-dependent aminotransferase [Burkholderiales bacterium]